MTYKRQWKHTKRGGVVSLLEEASEDFEKNILHNKMMLRTTWNTIRTLKYYNDVAPNVPFLQYMEEEYLIVSEIKLESFQDPLQLRYLQELIQYMTEHYLWNEIYVGSIVSQDRLEKGIISTNYWYARVLMPLQDDRMMIKPAGTYAVMDYYGSPYEMDAAHKRLISYIKENGYRIAGNAYEADFGGYWPADKDNNVLIRIMIQAEPQEGA